MGRRELSMGNVRLISAVGISDRLLRIFTFVSHKCWRRLQSDFGRFDDEITVLLHREGTGAGTVCIDDDGKPRLTAISLASILTLALKEIKEGNSKERLLRAFRAIVLEELFHIHERLSGREHEELDDYDVVRHYARDFEYRALCYVVEVTGERRELLEKVRAYRAEHGLE